jgi:uncharacterized protein YdaU (DUF1376 family)
MSKKNLPNIPIYIGDWEKDCNVLSLEAEAAWMRIIFKLWTKGKQNSIKIPTKSLQNLWRCSLNQMHEIIDELIYNEICEVSQSERFIEFTCRRFVKENKISEVRSKAGKSSKKEIKTKSKPKQKENKSEQNTDIDIDYDNENENKEKGGLGEKTNFDPDLLLEIPDLKSQLENEATWSETVIRNTSEFFPGFNKADFWNYLEQFIKQIQNDGEENKTVKDAKKHFSRWLNHQLKNQINEKSNNSEPKFGRQSLDDLKSNSQGWTTE